MATNVALEQKGILELKKLNEKLQKQLQADISKLYEDKTFCDFELSDRNRTVKGHRCIIKARAPNLYKEIVDTKVDDLSLDVIEDFLSDIYSCLEVKKKEEEVLKYLRKINHRSNAIKTRSNLLNYCKTRNNDLHLTREINPTAVYYCLVYPDSDDHLLSTEFESKKRVDYSANDIIDNYFTSMECTKNGEINPSSENDAQNLPTTAHDTVKVCEKNGYDLGSKFDVNVNASECNSGDGNDNSYLQDSGLEMNCEENDSINSKTLTIHSDAFEEQASERSTSISSAFSKTDKAMEENTSRRSLDINDGEWLNDEECCSCDDVPDTTTFSEIKNEEKVNIPSVPASNDKFTYFIDPASLLDKNESANNWDVTSTNDFENDKNMEVKSTNFLSSSNDMNLLNKNEQINSENGMESLCDVLPPDGSQKPILNECNNNFNEDKHIQHFTETEDQPSLKANNISRTETTETQSKSLFPMFIDIRQTGSREENSPTYQNGHTENCKEKFPDDTKRPGKKQGFYMFVDFANDKSECEMAQDSLTVTPVKSNDKWMDLDITNSQIPVDVFVNTEFSRISESAEPVKKTKNMINGKFENGLYKEETPVTRSNGNKHLTEHSTSDREQYDAKSERESCNAAVKMNIELLSKNTRKCYDDNALIVSQDKATPDVLCNENTSKNKYETNYKHSASDQSLSTSNKIISDDALFNKNKSQSFIFDFSSNNQLEQSKNLISTERNYLDLDKREVKEKDTSPVNKSTTNFTSDKHSSSSNVENNVSSSLVRESDFTPNANTPDSLNNCKVSDNFNLNGLNCETSVKTNHNNTNVGLEKQDTKRGIIDTSNMDKKLLQLPSDRVELKIPDAKIENNRFMLKMTEGINNRAATAESWTVSFGDDTSKSFINRPMMKNRKPNSVTDRKGKDEKPVVKKVVVKKDETNIKKVVKKDDTNVSTNINVDKQLEKKANTDNKVVDEVSQQSASSSANRQLFTMFIDVAPESERSVKKSDPLTTSSSVNVKTSDKAKNPAMIRDRGVYSRLVTSAKATSKSIVPIKMTNSMIQEKSSPSHVTKIEVEKDQKTVDLKIEQQVEDASSVEDNFVKLSDMDKMPSKLMIQERIPAQDRMSRSIPEMSWFDTKVLSGSANSRSLSRIFPHLTASVLSRTCSDADFTAASISSSMYSSIGTQNMDSNFATSLGADLLRMFLEEISPDVVIEVGGRRIKAHKCILSSRCQYFAAKLSGGWVLSAGNVISFPGFSYAIVHFALCHIYSGVSTIPDNIDINELSKFTDYICLEGLKEVISYKLKSQYCHFFHKPCNVCSSRVLECLTLAAQYNLDEIYTKSIQWINKYYAKIWVHERFLLLSPDLLDRLLRYQLHHQLNVDNILDTLMNCEKMLSMMYGIRWAKVVSIVRRLHDETIKYAAENFLELLKSDSFSTLAVDRVWNIDVMEKKVELISKKMSIDQLCSSYSVINRMKKMNPVQSADSNEDFIKLLSIVKNVLEQRLVKDASNALKCNSWFEMDSDLRRKIQSLSGIMLIRNVNTKSTNLNAKMKDTLRKQSVDDKVKPMTLTQLSHKKELEGKLNIIKKKEEMKMENKVSNASKGSITRSSSEPAKMHSVPPNAAATSSSQKKYVDIKPRYLLPKKAPEDMDTKKKNEAAKKNIGNKCSTYPGRGNFSRKDCDKTNANKRTPCKTVAAGSKDKNKPMVPAPLSRSGTFSKDKPTVLKRLP